MTSPLLMVLPGANDSEKLEALGATHYKQQAIWFLNAFWDDLGSQAEDIWKFEHKFEDLDLEKKAEGNGLDELNAHRFLEFFKDTHTVQELRQKLRDTGAIAQNARPKLVPIIHFLLFKYNVSFHTLVNASQGDNSKEIAEAERLLSEVSAAFEEADRTARSAAAALNEAKAREADATAREADAKEAEAAAKRAEATAIEQEAPFKKAQEEVDTALAEVKAQETARDNKTAELQKKSTEGGVVQQNKAKAELAQHLAEDPLPLRKAKITLEAALKRAEKARAPFEAATKAAEAATKAAVTARAAAVQAADSARAAKAASERAKVAADAAVEEASKRVAEAEAYLNEIRSRPGSAKGAIWWMDRELTERKAYLPESKGGYKKNK